MPDAVPTPPAPSRTVRPAVRPELTEAAAVERLCEVMHDAYERAAVSEGWQTQQASRKPWADVPEANKATMRAAVAALLAVLTAADVPQVEQEVRERIATEEPPMNSRHCTSSIRFGDTTIKCGKDTHHKMHSAFCMTDDDKRASVNWKDEVGFESEASTARLTAEREQRRIARGQERAR